MQRPGSQWENADVDSPLSRAVEGDRDLYLELAPPPHLAAFVECIWDSYAATERRGFLVMPDGCMDVIWAADDKPELVGTMTRSVRVHLHRGQRVRGVRFRPGMMALCLPISPSDLLDGRVSSRDFGIGRLTLKDFVAALRPRSMNPVQCALAYAASAREPVALDFLIRNSGLSSRQFRRQCLAVTGVSPKHLLRILRFRRASEAALAGAVRWPDLAANFGYFDQAHLIREFREFTGHSPISLVSDFSNTHAPDQLMIQA
jgi:AraC-like DNA-binding protein